MIKLSNRLEAIANLIDKDDFVIDIGCDHALLDIYLEKKYNKIYYASDLRKSALEMAEKNILKYNSSKVLLKCGNGLDTLDDDNINTVIISGMGYQTIIKILSNKQKLIHTSKIIIQSNTNPEIIRKYMINNGYYIDKEVLVKDKNIYYAISLFKRGSKMHSKKDILIGKFDNNNIYKEYLKKEHIKNKLLLNIIPRKYIFKRYNIKKTIKLIENS